MLPRRRSSALTLPTPLTLLALGGLTWKSVQLEQDTSSLCVLLAGNHASRSYFLAAALLSSPLTMFTTR